MASHNPGYITSSTVKKLLTGKGNKLIKGGKNFAKQLARERFGITDEQSSYSGGWATEWGNQHEALAIERYYMEEFRDIHGMQESIVDGWLSCTPDGLVGEEGMIEIKCPYNTDNHMDNLINNSFIKKYEAQARFQMMLSGRKWNDLVSYDPRWAEKGLDLHIVRFERDPEWEASCMDRIRQAEEIISETLEKLESLHD